MENSLGVRRTGRLCRVRPFHRPCRGDYRLRSRYRLENGILAVTQFPSFSTLFVNSGRPLFSTSRNSLPTSIGLYLFDRGLAYFVYLDAARVGYAVVRAVPGAARPILGGHLRVIEILQGCGKWWLPGNRRPGPVPLSFFARRCRELVGRSLLRAKLQFEQCVGFAFQPAADVHVELVRQYTARMGAVAETLRSMGHRGKPLALDDAAVAPHGKMEDNHHCIVVDVAFAVAPEGSDPALRQHPAALICSMTRNTVVGSGMPAPEVVNVPPGSVSSPSIPCPVGL